MSPDAAPRAVGHSETGSGDVFYNRTFAVVDSVEVCFRQGDAAANLRAAATWLTEHAGWYLRTLWYEHHGAAEMAQLDDGPRGVLWLIAEQGSDDEPPTDAGGARPPAGQCIRRLVGTAVSDRRHLSQRSDLEAGHTAVA